MDYTQVPDMQLDSEMSGAEHTAIIEYIETRLRDLHTSMPGVVVSFNATKQTAVVQPSIKRVFIVKEPNQPAVVSQVNLPVCLDVPVVFPGGGGFFLTFPVMAGDECLLQFSERAIDFWYQNGGQQLPSEYRLHDLSDAIALVGLNSQPHVIPSFNASACELRTRDGAVKLTLSPSGVGITGNLTVNNNIGFYGHASAIKPIIMGSKSGNVALANLLTALAGLGLLTDSTT